MGWSQRLLAERREAQAASGYQVPRDAGQTLVDYETGERVVRSYRCPDCQNRSMLVNRWNATASSYEVICGGCGRTTGFVREESLTQRWRENPDAVPVHTANALERKYGGRPMTTTQLATADEKSLVQRMEGARWLAQLPPNDKKALAQLSVQYGLDPLMGELTLYEGKPYISVNGMVRIAHEHPAFEGLEDRPMTEEEKQAYGITQRVGWIALVYRKGWRAPVKGTGAADPDRPFRNNPVERERPQWMARARAIRQALRLAFPHSVPFRFGMADERGRVIDVSSGEIVDGEPVQESESQRAQEDERPDDGAAGVSAGGFVDDGREPLPDETGEESRRLDLLAALREHAEATGPDGWDKLCRWWKLHYNRATPESSTLAELEAAYQKLGKKQR